MKITSIVTDSGYHNVQSNCVQIARDKGSFYLRHEGVMPLTLVLAKDVWQVTVKDENGKETHIRATNYADANGPYHWPEGLPWTPIS